MSSATPRDPDRVTARDAAASSVAASSVAASSVAATYAAGTHAAATDGAGTHAAGTHAALVLRVTLGLMFIAHLYWKFEILPGGLDRWKSGLIAAGYPAFVPWYVLSAEIAGALLLIPGICTRWASLYALPMMLGAAQFWLSRKGFYFTSGGAELPIVWSIMLVLQAMLGDGPYSVTRSARRSPDELAS